MTIFESVCVLSCREDLEIADWFLKSQPVNRLAEPRFEVKFLRKLTLISLSMLDVKYFLEK